MTDQTSSFEDDETSNTLPKAASNDQMRKRIAHAIHRYDNHHALSGNDMPSKHHYGEADFVLAELRRELGALAEYEHTINWMTTCTGCARVLDSCIRETRRAERAETTLARVRRLCDLTIAASVRAQAVEQARDTLAILDEPKERQEPPVVDRQTAVVLSALHHSAETTVTRVIDLYERWVKAGPPPLGTSLSRWWDTRLAELHAAINPKEN